MKLDHGSLRCGGISLTLISLVELGVVLRGLYFFSTGGASDGAELQRATRLSLKLKTTQPAEGSMQQVQLMKRM